MMEMQEAVLAGQELDEAAVSGPTDRDAMVDPFGILARLIDVPGQAALALSAMEQASGLSGNELFYLRAYTRASSKPARTPMLLRAAFVTSIGIVEPLATCTGPSTPPTNARATLARSALPAIATLSQTTVPAISAPALPRPALPGRSGTNGRAHGRCTLDSATNVKPKPPTSAARPWPSVEADGYTDRATGPAPVRYTSVDAATQRFTALQGDTRWDREETARIAVYPQLAGRFRRWWQVLGSNQRRLSRRFYSPILLFESYVPNLPLCARRQNLGPPPSAMCPCAGSQRRGDARTGTDGGVERPRLHPRSGPFWPLTCSVQDAISPSPSSSPPGSGSVSLAPRASAMRWLAASACPSMSARRS